MKKSPNKLRRGEPEVLDTKSVELLKTEENRLSKFDGPDYSPMDSRDDGSNRNSISKIELKTLLDNVQYAEMTLEKKKSSLKL